MTLSSRYRLTGLTLLLLLTGFLAQPARAQEETPPPPPTYGGGSSVSTEPRVKDWFPRLSGLPFQKSNNDTIFIGNTEYLARIVRVTFFRGTSAAFMRSAVTRYPTEEIRVIGEGWSYVLSLSNAGDLFAALDTLNDLPDVKSAKPEAVTMDTTISPTPFPTRGEGSPADGLSQDESLWPGDVDGNFTWEIGDVIRTLRASVGLDSLTPLAATRADFNRSGKVEVSDAILTLSVIVTRRMPPPYGYPTN